MRRSGLGQMPLTLWILVAAIVLYLYIRRASLGIDLHPGERVTVQPPTRPSVFIGPIQPYTPTPFTRPDTSSIPPYLPPIPGTPNGPAGVIQ